MALGCVTLNPARNCHFAEYKNVHNTTLSTKIALYTYEKMVQIYVGNMINISVKLKESDIPFGRIGYRERHNYD